MSQPPPEALVRSLVDGPSRLSGLEFHPEVASTNAVAVEAARRGVAEIHAVAADVQTAGRGRMGRVWQAPAGTSLLVSLVLRPRVDEAALATLPLLVGSVLAEVVTAHLREGPDEPDVALKWPNDLLVGGRKAAGILVERHPEAAIAGIGCNVDWRGLERPDDLAAATSLAEEAGRAVDRWKLLAGLVGVLDRRYVEWQDDPAATLAGFRARCATIGQDVRVERPGAAPTTGRATGIAADGRLLVATAAGEVAVDAGDVVHVRPADG